MKKMFFAAVAALIMSVSFSSCTKTPEERFIGMLKDLVELKEEVQSNPLKLISIGDDIQKLSAQIKGIDVSQLNFTEAQQQQVQELIKKSGLGSFIGF